MTLQELHILDILVSASEGRYLIILTRHSLQDVLLKDNGYWVSVPNIKKYRENTPFYTGRSCNLYNRKKVTVKFATV